MRNSRLIQLLSKLDKKELKELKEFVRCRLFHSNKKQYDIVVLLFEELISRSCKVLFPSKENLYAKIFGNKPFDTKKLNHFLARGTDLVQKYYIYQQQNEDTVQSNIFLLRAFRNRNLDTFFQQLKGKIQQNLKKDPERSSIVFYNGFAVEQLGLVYNALRNKRSSNDKEGFKNVIANLDLFFLINELNYACNSINSNRIINAPIYDFPLLKSVIEALPDTIYLQLPEIRLYWNAYQMLVTNEEAYYQALKTLLFEHYTILMENEHVSLFRYLSNYCAWAIGKGNQDYYTEYWEVTLYQLDMGIQTSIQIYTYKNLVTVGTMLAVLQKDASFKAITHFLEKHTDKLQKKYQQEAQLYGNAYVAFYKGKLETVIDNLILEQNPLIIFKFKDIFYQIDARRLLLMTYFLLKDENAFDKLCNNIGVFLSDRKKVIPAIELEKNRQFLMFIKKIIRLPFNRVERQTKLEQVKKEIAECKNVSDRTWLSNQVNRLLQ